MKTRVAWLIVILAAAAFLISVRQMRTSRNAPYRSQVITETGSATALQETIESTGSANPFVPGTTATTTARQPNLAPIPVNEDRATVSPSAALDKLRVTIRLYGSMFGGNPVGTNLEITRALNGDNPKHVHFLDGARLNGKGELIDDWGTPYFFHQLSGQQTEIRSAGPDKRMWTGDDIVLR